MIHVPKSQYQRDEDKKDAQRQKKEQEKMIKKNKEKREKMVSFKVYHYPFILALKPIIQDYLVKNRSTNFMNCSDVSKIKYTNKSIYVNYFGYDVNNPKITFPLLRDFDKDYQYDMRISNSQKLTNNLLIEWYVNMLYRSGNFSDPSVYLDDKLKFIPITKNRITAKDKSGNRYYPDINGILFNNKSVTCEFPRVFGTYKLFFPYVMVNDFSRNIQNLFINTTKKLFKMNPTYINSLDTYLNEMKHTDKSGFLNGDDFTGNYEYDKLKPEQQETYDNGIDYYKKIYDILPSDKNVTEKQEQNAGRRRQNAGRRRQTRRKKKSINKKKSLKKSRRKLKK